MSEQNTTFRQSVVCPNCKNELAFLKKVQIRKTFKLEEFEIRSPRLPEEENFERSECMDCPHCSAVLQLHLEIKILEVEVLPVKEAADPGVRIKKEFGGLLTEYRNAGVVNAFEQAVHALHTEASARPSDTELYFLRFLSGLNFVPIKRYEAAVKALCGGLSGSIELWLAFDIGMIVVGGQIRRFVPFKLLRRTRQTPVRLMGQQGASMSDLGQLWVRTRNGYVPLTSRVFLEEMRTKSKGAFARLVQ